MSLLSGVLIALVVVVISIRVTVEQLGQTSTTALLAGETDFAEVTRTLQTKRTEIIKMAVNCKDNR